MNLYAPKEYLSLSELEKKAKCNGCGTKGLPGLLVPDTLYGLSIEECCNIHDFMYGIGETIEDKDEADRVFLNNMIRVINANTKNGFMKWLRRLRAMKYYSAVKDFGGPAFWSGKD